MKKTFREIVFVYEDLSLNCKENELNRKYKVFGGSTENEMDCSDLEMNKMDGSIGFSMSQSV